jgi:uncharacterized protein YaaQ
MKLVVAVIQDKDSSTLSSKLIANNFRATKLASTGGLLKAGNTTFLIGVEDDKVDDLLSLIHSTCQSRKQVLTPTNAYPAAESLHLPLEVVVGGATVFVLPIDSFHHF